MIYSPSLLSPDPLTARYRGEALDNFCCLMHSNCYSLDLTCVKYGIASPSVEEKGGVQVSCKEDHTHTVCDIPKFAAL